MLSNHPAQIIWPADSKLMVLVPAGPFIFGYDNPLRGQEGPAHQVDLAAFYIDRLPVTVAEFLRFVSISGYPLPRMLQNQRLHHLANHPVRGVAWRDAYHYASWAGKRLPSEAEWEKAASWDAASQQKRIYPWGNSWDARRCNMLEAARRGTTPVGTYSPYGDAWCGAADMAGNVWEWTASLNWNYPYQPGDGRDDPQRPGTRVRRGGAYNSEELYARTFTRQLNDPDIWLATEGFRCVTPLGVKREA